LKELIEKSTEKTKEGKILVKLEIDPNIFSLILESMYTFQVKPKPEQILPLIIAADYFELSKFSEYLRIGCCTPGK
jgi:hypothetical protein